MQFFFFLTLSSFFGLPARLFLLLDAHSLALNVGLLDAFFESLTLQLLALLLLEELLAGILASLLNREVASQSGDPRRLGSSFARSQSVTCAIGSLPGSRLLGSLPVILCVSVSDFLLSSPLILLILLVLLLLAGQRLFSLLNDLLLLLLLS